MDIQKITLEILQTGLTQQELADLVPCSQATVSAFCKGKRGKRPSLQIGERLAAIHRERMELPDRRKEG